MNAYIAQLNRLAERKPHLVFPSHGPVVAMPDRLIQHYIDHREKRHQLVLEAVEGGLRELAEIARQAYVDTRMHTRGWHVTKRLPTCWPTRPMER